MSEWTKDRYQEIARRGLQDKLAPDKRARFDEGVRRGLITLPTAADPSRPTPTGRGRAGQLSQNRRADHLASLTPEKRALLEDIGPIEGAVIGAGRGFTDVARGVGAMDPIGDDERRQFDELTAAQPTATAGQIVGQAAPFVPLGLGVGAVASTPVRVLATSGVGGLEGGIIRRGEGETVEDSIKSAGVGAVVAGVIELALPIIGRIGRKIFLKVGGKPPQGPLVTPDGGPTPEFQTALDAADIKFDDVVNQARVELGDLSPDEAVRKTFLESQGLTPTRAQVTRDASDFQAQQEAAKTSGPLRDALTEQDLVLTTRFDDVVRGTDGDFATDTNTVVDALVEKSTVLDREISALYKQAREAAPGEKSVRLHRLVGMLREAAGSDTAAGGNISAMVGELRKAGVVGKKGLKVTGRIDVDTAERLRQFANSLHSNANEFGNIRLREIKSALDEDVFEAAGQDVFEAGRAAKREFEQGLTRAKISKFDNRRANLVRDVLENKIDPDQFADKVVFSKTWRAPDLQQLRDYITTDQQGVAAIKDLKADVLDKIRQKAFTGAEDAAQMQTLNVGALEKTLKAIGEPKLRVLFDSKEREFLSNLVRVGKLRQPVTGTALGLGPSGQLARAITEQTGVVGRVFDAITINNAGRVAMQAAPPPKTPAALEALRGVAPVAGAAAVTAQQEQ